MSAHVAYTTMDMGLEYEYITPEGYGVSLGNIGQWPVYCLKGITEDYLKRIQSGISNNTLVEEELGETDLAVFYKTVFQYERPCEDLPSASEFLLGLLKIKLIENEQIYVLSDAGDWHPKASFFSSYEEMEQAFLDEYAYVIDEKWDDVADKDLEYWYEQYTNEMTGITINELYDM